MKRFFLSLCLLLTTASFSSAQAPFQNLDFETFYFCPVLPIYPNPPVECAELTEWNIVPGFIPNLSLVPDLFLNINFVESNGPPLAGTASIVLGPGVDPVTFVPQDIGISQTGLVPSSSRSIQLLASAPPIQEILDFDDLGLGGGTPTGVFETLWSISLGGNEIPLTEISPGLWAGDFDPSLAGTSQLLSIDINSSFVDVESPQFQQLVSFDNISFLPEAGGDPVLLGDCNLDGEVDFLDVFAMIDLLISGEYLLEADCNEDDELNFSDIEPFIVILSNN